MRTWSRPSHGDRALPEVRLVEPGVDENGLARLSRGLRAPKGLCYFGIRLYQYSLGSEACSHFMISGAGQDGADVILEDFHLLAGNLRPAGIVADDCNDRDAVADERVELGKAISAGAIAKKNPDFSVRPAKSCAQSKSAANAQRSERSRIKPGSRSTRPQDVRCGGDKIAAIGNEDGVVAGLRIRSLLTARSG